MAHNYNKLGWRDQTTDAIIRGGANAPSYAVYRNGIYQVEMPDNLVRELFFNFHLNHDYVPAGGGGSGFGGRGGVHFHVHWGQIGTVAGNVEWHFEYTIARGNNQAAFPASSTVTVIQAANTSPPYQHMIAETADISNAECVVDSIIMCRRYRDASGGNADDTLAASVFAFTADIHYECCQFNTKNKSPDFFG